MESGAANRVRDTSSEGRDSLAIAAHTISQSAVLQRNNDDDSRVSITGI